MVGFQMSYSHIIAPFTPLEWNRARELYKSREKSELEELVRMITMWISRSIANAPVAINCSKVLLNAILADFHFETLADSEKGTYIDNLLTAHGHGITRFINYVNEIGQQPQPDRLLSIVNAVSELGIPSWLVEVRHAVAHQDMPPIGTLRTSTNWCLNWLGQEFWKKKADDAMNSGRAGIRRQEQTQFEEEERRNDEKKKEEYIRTIRQFCNWRYKNLQMTEFQRETIPELLKISNHLILNANKFLRTLIMNGILIQTPDQLRQASRITSDDPSYQIPEEVQKFWEPMFLLIFELGFTTEFISALLVRLLETDLETTSQHQIVAYSRDIIEQCVKSDSIAENEWPQILNQILLVPSFFEGQLIMQIMGKVPNLSRKRRNQIRRILNISIKYDNNVNLDDSMEIKTVEDLQKLVRKEKKTETVARETKTSRIFEQCDPDDWVNIQVGMSPDQRIETFTLIITSEDLTQSNRKRKNQE